MKKILAVSFCTTLVLGFAASAFAIHIEAPAETSSVIAKGGLVTLDGSVRNRGFLTSTSTAEDATMQKSGYDLRVRLGASIKTGDQVSGRVLLENNSGSSWGDAWGFSNAGNLNVGGEKKSAMHVLEAWAQYVPGNWGVKVGHMPLALGNKLFFDHTSHGDDAIVAFMNPNDATHLAALTIKFTEDLSVPESVTFMDTTGDGLLDSLTGTPAVSTGGAGSNRDDINGYVLLGTYKAGAMNFGGDWTYLHNYGSGMEFSNIGLRGDLDAGNFKIKGDVEFQTGKVMEVGTMEADAAGWAAMLDASTKVGGAWGLGAALYYATGDAYDETDTDVDMFVDFLGNTRYQSTINGYILASPATGMKNGGISNQTQVQVYATTNTQMMGKDLSLKGRLNWMKVNEEQYMDQDDEIGIELELFATWKLAQGLVYGVEAAYLFTGDAWIPDAAAVAAGADVDNVFFLRHRLELAW